MNAPDIIFPNIGIEFQNIDSVAFKIFGIEVYWYGIIITLGIMAGLFIAMKVAKKTGQNPEIYSELLLYGLVGAILGARMYYVVFAWDQYKDNLLDIFAFREGGLAIYGGVIGAVIVAYVFARKKKLNKGLIFDTGAVGLVLGQAIGRWGNFMNMEAFGGYSEGLFAMAIQSSKAKYIPDEVKDKIIMIHETPYIQVHPTFFYESMWCLVVLVLLLIWFNYKKFDGEIFLLYLFGYGIGRAWIEGLRTDQLFLWNTGIPVSQLLSILLVILALIIVIFKRKNIMKGLKNGNHG